MTTTATDEESYQRVKQDLQRILDDPSPRFDTYTMGEFILDVAEQLQQSLKDGTMSDETVATMMKVLKKMKSMDHPPEYKDISTLTWRQFAQHSLRNLTKN